MKNYLKYAVVISFLGVYTLCSAQGKPVRKIDSLNAIIKTASVDSNKVNNLIRLVREFLKAANFDSAEICGQQALGLAQKVNYTKGISSSYNNLGVVNHYLGNYPKALDYYSKALKMRKEAGDKKGVAGSYNNMAKVYYNQGNYPMSLECVLKALEIIEKTDDKSTLASLYNDIGNLCLDKNEKALANYLKALKIYREIKDKLGIGYASNNIGVVYGQLGDYKKSLTYYQEALKIKEEIGDKKGIANTLDNIGGVYVHEKNYDKALECHLKSEQINKELGEKVSMGPPLNNIAIVYLAMGNLQKALTYATKSFEMAKEAGSLEHIKDAEKTLTDIYRALHNDTEAFKHYRGFIASRDSLYNEENTRKKVRAEMNFDFEKQKAVEKAEQEKKDMIQQEETQRQKQVRNSLIVGFVLLLFVAFLIFRNYKQKKQANELLKTQKEEIEIQKMLLEMKNQEVTDSIKYAQRIQAALFTSENYIKKHVNDFFILNKPKDIVSGDFYWFLKRGNYFYIATSDCTGHGVPGAFMSMMGINFLNEIIIERKISDPGEILTALRAEIIKALNPEGSTELGKDGMDIVLCRFDFEKQVLDYAAANSTFYIVSDGNLTVQKFDKMPVGIHTDNLNDFTTFSLQLKKDDAVYTFTDGYADQFGGAKGKKFKYKQLEELLVSNCKLPMDEQKNNLNNKLEDWRGNLEQVDDVLIIGLRVQ